MNDAVVREAIQGGNVAMNSIIGPILEPLLIESVRGGVTTQKGSLTMA